jgi:hypothetical protein
MRTTLKIAGARRGVANPQAKSAQPAYRLRLSTDTPMTRWRGWVMFLGLTTMFIIASLWNPPDDPLIVLCPFRALTHHPCPGCGMTRAFCALAHGEFWRAVKFNALSPLLFLAVLAAWAYGAAVVLRAERLRSFLARLFNPRPLVIKLMLAFVLAWWVSRLVWGF